MARIYLCSGFERPRTVKEVFRTQLGHTEWDRRLDITIPVRQSGIAQWLVFVEGLDVRAVKLKDIIMVKEGTAALANISRTKLDLTSHG